MAERQTWHRKYSLVLFAPFAVVIWRSRSRTVPKSLSRRQCVNYLKKRRITYRETRLNTAVEFMICWKSFLGSHLYGDRCRFPATVVPEDHIVPLLSRWVTWALCCLMYFVVNLGFLKTAHSTPPPPQPKPTLSLSSHLGQNVGLGEGWVGSFPETQIAYSADSVQRFISSCLNYMF